MSDLINRQEVNDALDRTCNLVCQYSKKQRYMMCGACPLGSAFDAITEVPAIDPVKHGTWLPHPTETDWDVCSVCGIGTHRRFHGYDNGGFWDSEESFQYCPWCGAKLDGGEENG